MKQIEPISTWIGGEVKTAEFFDLRIIADDLQSSCTFYYELRAKSVDAEGNISSYGEVVSNGNLSLGEPEYDTWDGSNDWAYNWAAGKLNLQIIA